MGFRVVDYFEIDSINGRRVAGGTHIIEVVPTLMDYILYLAKSVNDSLPSVAEKDEVKMRKLAYGTLMDMDPTLEIRECRIHTPPFLRREDGFRATLTAQEYVRPTRES